MGSHELDELISFLSSPSKEIQKAAVDIVHGLTGTDEGVENLASRVDSLVPKLLALLEVEQEVAKSVAEVLVNLSPQPKLSEALIEAGVIERTMELIGPKRPRLNGPLIMLLANLTQLESGVERLLQDKEKQEGLYIRKLVRLFSRFSSEDEESEDQYEHVAAILVNISRLQIGRKLILDTNKGLLKQILPQIDARSIVRRKGVAGTVRNCCFEAETQLPSLLLNSQFLWPALLLPLAGKKAYSQEDTSKMPLELANPLSHEREVEMDPQVRIEAADAVYLLALQEGGRRALWAVNGPRILQVGYEDEEDPQVMEAYERLGSLLVQGEEFTQ